MRPHLGDVPRIKAIAYGLGLSHALDINRPRWEISCGDSSEQVPRGIIGVSGYKFNGLLSSKIPDALVRLEVPFDIAHLAPLVDQLERVARVAVHVSISLIDGSLLYIRSSTVGEQDGNLMNGLWHQAQKIPKGIWVLQVGLRVSFLGVNKVGKLARVPDEKNRRIVADHVPVAFFCVKLDSKAARVSLRVGRALFASDRGEAGENGRALADLCKESCLAPLADLWTGYFEVAMRSGSFSMNNSLGDSLAVKVGQLVQQVEILNKPTTGRRRMLEGCLHGPFGSGCLRVLVIVNRISIRGGQKHAKPKILLQFCRA